MAKDTPNKSGDTEAIPADEKLKQEQTAPGEVVVPADKINQLTNDRQAAEQTAEGKQPKAPASEEQTTTAKTGRRGRPPKDKAEQAKPPEADKKPEEKKRREARPPTGVKKEETPAKEPEPEKPLEPVEAPRPDKTEEITYIKLSELHPFKDHPFSVRDDAEMRAMVESVKDKGVTQPAVVRPREDGGYELVSGHRRQKASELAGYSDMPCIVRNLTDEQAITQMVEDNTNQRESLLPSERAKAYKMQLDAIKRQGSRDNGNGMGQRSNEIVAERNKMNVKQVQRYIKLNDLTPELLKMADEGVLKFTPAVELAFVSKKNQQYIAIAIEAQQSSPNLSQAQRLRELDGKKLLNPDVIDGIMLEEKKEVDKVILSTQELAPYFGREVTPREMKDTILRLLDENKGQQKDIAAPEKKNEPEK